MVEIVLAGKWLATSCDKMRQNAARLRRKTTDCDRRGALAGKAVLGSGGGGESVRHAGYTLGGGECWGDFWFLLVLKAVYGGWAGRDWSPVGVWCEGQSGRKALR